MNFLFANFGTFFLYPYTPCPLPPTREEEGRGVRRWVCFWMHFFCLQNFGTFLLYPYTPSPLPPPGRRRGGRRWVCFWMHFFCKFWNIFSSTLYHLPPPPATWEEEGEGGGGWVGDGYVFGCFFLQILEHFSSTLYPPPPHLGGEGRGEGWGWGVFLDAFFCTFFEYFWIPQQPPPPPPPCPLVLGQGSEVSGYFLLRVGWGVGGRCNVYV